MIGIQQTVASSQGHFCQLRRAVKYLVVLKSSLMDTLNVQCFDPLSMPEMVFLGKAIGVRRGRQFIPSIHWWLEDRRRRSELLLSVERDRTRYCKTREIQESQKSWFSPSVFCVSSTLLKSFDTCVRIAPPRKVQIHEVHITFLCTS